MTNGADQPGQSVTIQVTHEDMKLLEDLVDGSPFNQQTILSIALRVGMSMIRKDPKVLLPFIGKKQG
jgi:hypothetical protein